MCPKITETYLPIERICTEITDVLYTELFFTGTWKFEVHFRSFSSNSNAMFDLLHLIPSKNRKQVFRNVESLL
jgi:hypothetical protein